MRSLCPQRFIGERSHASQLRINLSDKDVIQVGKTVHLSSQVVDFIQRGRNCGVVDDKRHRGSDHPIHALGGEGCIEGK
jgi:hypothetical protein